MPKRFPWPGPSPRSRPRRAPPGNAASTGRWTWTCRAPTRSRARSSPRASRTRKAGKAWPLSSTNARRQGRNNWMSDDFILETRGLTKEFKGFVAVQNVSLKVQRGSIHALIGPNGAGKTTCFNLLTHFLEPTRGEIIYNGRKITGSSPASIARMGLARSFQISAVFPHLTVLENVRIALQRKRGGSFDFWRSEAILDRLNDRARELIDAVESVQY